MSTKLTMDDLLEQQDLAALKSGDVVQATVIEIKKHEIWLDLGPRGIGVVLRREIGNQKLEIGQEITASVIDPEIEEGYGLLSLRKAVKDRGWDELARIVADEDVIEVTAYDANRGGLLIEIEGIRGFMPVSQLSADNYPRVSSADKDEILQKLNALIGKSLRVRILDASRKDNKLIFSEKAAIKDDMQAKFAQLTVGDTVKGGVTGVIDFGAFVNVGGIEGLIHISEISWERVEDPRKYIKTGDKIEAKIIAIDKDRLSLSIKQLTEDPWLKDVEKFKKDQIVEGKITRITPFGAFVQLTPAVEALVHVSEMGGGEEDGVDPEKIFKLNETKKFKVLDINTDSRKIALSLKGA